MERPSTDAFVSEQERVKILVLGDTGVGKSCLVQLLCTGKVLAYSPWTAGANVDVLLFEHPLARKKYFIEFFDIGGSSRYEVARGVFFENTDGVIFVHDLSNKKSRTNLKKWVRELAMKLDPDSTYSWSKVAKGEGDHNEDSPILDLKYHNGEDYVPVLMIGNKADLATGTKSESSVEDGSFQLELSAMDPSYVAEGSPAQQTLRAFYQRVVDKKHKVSASQGSLFRGTTLMGSNIAGGTPTSNRAKETTYSLANLSMLGNRKV